MKSNTLKRKIASKLSELGVTLTPDGAADRKVSQFADIGAAVVNKSQRTIRTVQKEIDGVTEAARAAVHDATKPKKKSGRR